MALDPSRTINGSYGELFIDGVWQTQVQRVEGRITIQRREVRLAGSRQTGYKATGTAGDGTITGFKVTSHWLRTIGAYQRHSASRMADSMIRYTIADPENGGIEEVELLGVKFWEVPIGFQVDELVEEAIPFTFVNHNMRQCIDINLDTWVTEGADCA
jgi:hypothetical protein